MKDMVCLYDVYYSDEESFLRTASTISIKYKNREDVLYQFVMESAEFLEWLRIRFVNIDKLRKRDAIELFLGWANTKTYTYNTWMIEQTSI
jgi:hypothetical protein